MGTFRGKPRRNGRACGRQCLRSATGATRSKGPRGPATGYGPHRTIYLTGIDAMARLTSGQGWPWVPTAPIDTGEEILDNSPVVVGRGQNILQNRRGGRSAPTAVNSSVRTREYLTTAEIERLMAAARKSSRYGHRDATMILIGYRHGLRASELCDLQWSQIELATGRLHVRRAKNGSPSVHPMQGDEIRALRRLQREQGLSSHVFMSERDAPMTPKAFHALFGRIGSRAKMQFPIHPHMLRHGCGYALANAGHDTRALQAWLGHRNIQHTVRYTELAPDRFKNFWRD